MLHSVELLQKAEKIALNYDAENGFYLAFSGGKDSQALYHITQLAGVRFHGHMNLDEHLSKEQYKHLMEVAAREGCNYFTFNIPNTVCNDCGHITKHNLDHCPACGSKNVDYLTRIIGYLKRISNFSKARQEEAGRRYYAKGM